jgi:hypothetical protein
MNLEDRVEHGEDRQRNLEALRRSEHDAAQAVTDTMVTWLRARSPALSGPADS